MLKHNMVKTSFKSIPENESLARVICASFISVLDPTIEELTDVKTAVSEAVTNSIVHGYSSKPDGIVYMDCFIEDNTLTVEIRDSGKGIEDIQKAMEPMYTTREDLERSGMGFVFMEAFMDTVSVESKEGEGTKVTMTKKVGKRYGTDL